MKIGGFQPFTLSDYPGKVAAIVFTQGCNFKCPFCHNHALISSNESDTFEETTILEFLEKRKNQLDGVVITGGEPTLQADLIRFCQNIHEMGLSVKLDTNGSKPSVLEELIRNKYIDYIAMDVKAPPNKYPLLTGCPFPPNIIEKSIDIIAQSHLPHEFRTTHVESLLNQTDTDEIDSMIPENSLHKWQQYIPDHALSQQNTHPF